MKSKVKSSSYKKGQSGNKRGRPKLPSDILVVRTLTKIEFTRILNRVFSFTVDELKVYAEAPETSVLERAVASVVVKAIQLGDPVRLEMLLTRMIGKPKEEIEVALRNPYENMSDDQVIELNRNLRRLNAETHEVIIPDDRLPAVVKNTP